MQSSQDQHNKRTRRRRLALKCSAIVAGISLSMTMLVQACSNGSPPINGNGSTPTPPPNTACASPAPGCACATPGDTAPCGSTVAVKGNQAQCQEGTMTCGSNGWGACTPTGVTTFKSMGGVSLGGISHFLPSNSPEAGCADPCDPYCSTFGGDNSNGIDGGVGLTGTEAGGWVLTDAPPPADVQLCTGNQCFVAACDAGQTELVGRIMDPAGNYPINNALVMIPNGGIIPPMADGVHYNPCLSSSLPSVLAVTFTDPTGAFILGNAQYDGGGSVPSKGLPLDGGTTAGLNVPIMIQAGRWRRLTTVNISNACAVNDAGPINLPAVQGGPYGQDNIPHIGIITSSCDPFECMVNDFGVDRTQFSSFGKGGRIELLWSYDEGTTNANTGGVNPAAFILNSDGTYPDAAANGFQQLLSSQSVMSKYDMVMLPCRCNKEYDTQVGGNDIHDQNGYRQNLVAYANSGGRIFISHWGREWIERPTDSAFDAGKGSGSCTGAACQTGTSQTLSQCTTTSTCGWNGACVGNPYCPAQTASTTCTNSTGVADICSWGPGCSVDQGCVNPTVTDQGTCSGVSNATTGVSDNCNWNGTCLLDPGCTNATNSTACNNAANASATPDSCNPWSAGCVTDTACNAATTAGTCTTATNGAGTAETCGWSGGCATDPGCTGANGTDSLTCAAVKNAANTPDNCSWTSCATDTTCSTANGTNAATCAAVKNAANHVDGCVYNAGICSPAPTWNSLPANCATSFPTATAAQCNGTSNVGGKRLNGCKWIGTCAPNPLWNAAPATCTNYASDENGCNGTSTVGGHQVTGCKFTGGGCTTTPKWNGAGTTCNTYANDKSACNGTALSGGHQVTGCSFTGGGCTPSATSGVCSFYNSDKANCNNYGGCTFSGPGCVASATNLTCNAQANDLTACNNTNGCTFTGTGCTGVTGCGTTTNNNVETSCTSTPGCTFTGGCTSLCSTATQPLSCNAISGCSWQGDAGANWVPNSWVPFPNVANWITDNGSPLNSNGWVNATPTFSRGTAFSQWFNYTGGADPLSVALPRQDISSVIAPSALFIYGWENSDPANASTIDAGDTTSAGPNTVYDFTFDTPIFNGQTGEGGIFATAGRVMYSDMHTSETTQNPVLTMSLGGQTVPVFNSTYTLQSGRHECNPPEAGLNDQERVAEFLIFDLGSCQSTGLPPLSPPAKSYFAPETYTRDYCVAPSSSPGAGGCGVTCSNPNSSVVWRGFSWSSIIPGEADGGSWPPDSGQSPNLVFSFQSAPTQAALGFTDGGGGSGATPIYTLPPSTTSGAHVQDVSKLVGPTGSEIWLRVTMTLNPDSTNQLGPNLTAWQQAYDCVPSQ